MQYINLAGAPFGGGAADMTGAHPGAPPGFHMGGPRPPGGQGFGPNFPYPPGANQMLHPGGGGQGMFNQGSFRSIGKFREVHST